MTPCPGSTGRGTLALICSLGQSNVSQATRLGAGIPMTGKGERQAPSPRQQRKRSGDALCARNISHMRGRRHGGCLRGAYPRKGDNDHASCDWSIGPTGLRLVDGKGRQPCGKNWINNKSVPPGQSSDGSWESKTIFPKFRHPLLGKSCLRQLGKSAQNSYLRGLAESIPLARRPWASDG